MKYLADGHHVDDAGNLIACTYVDFRDPAERFQKASSKQHAIPGCETIRILRPACFLDRGEGFADGGESHHGTNGWIYCASIEPETDEEQAVWRKAMPAGRGAVSPIRRPRAFARALPLLADSGNLSVAPRRYGIETPQRDPRETAAASAVAEALREAVERADAAGGNAAAAVWHAEPVVRFLCATFGCRIPGMRVSEDGLVVITAELPGEELIEVSIAVGPEGTCGCKISAGETHLASTAADARSCERVLKERLTEVGPYAARTETRDPAICEAPDRLFEKRLAEAGCSVTRYSSGSGGVVTRKVSRPDRLGGHTIVLFRT